MTDAALVQPRNRAILLMITAILCFTLMDASAKALARSLGPRIDAGIIDMTIQALKERWETEEAAEGIGAFFDKRKAAWMG